MKVGRTSCKFGTIWAMLSANAVTTPREIAIHSRILAKMCASGRNRSCSSSEERRRQDSSDSHSKQMFLWVRTTPLGGPVVPDV